MQSATVTAAILTHNEANMLAACLETVSWSDQCIVLDHHSSDETTQIAQKAGARVISSLSDSFGERREQLLAACTTEWILYIDADERVTPELAMEIKKLLSEPSSQGVSAASFPRRNFFFGRDFMHGGWQHEQVTRLFRTSALKGWKGTIHESPIVDGKVEVLTSPLWHFSHRTVADGLIKTAHWTPMEAALLAENVKSPVSIWTILRKGLSEFWRRGVRQAGWRDGQAGMIEVLTQVINRMLVYMQVWEKQQKPPTVQRYQHLEKEIESLWQNSR